MRRKPKDKLFAGFDLHSNNELGDLHLAAADRPDSFPAGRKRKFQRPVEVAGVGQGQGPEPQSLRALDQCGDAADRRAERIRRVDVEMNPVLRFHIGAAVFVTQMARLREDTYWGQSVHPARRHLCRPAAKPWRGHTPGMIPASPSG